MYTCVQVLHCYDKGITQFDHMLSMCLSLIFIMNQGRLISHEIFQDNNCFYIYTYSIIGCVLRRYRFSSKKPILNKKREAN